MDQYFEREDLNKFATGYLAEDGKENWDRFMQYYGGVFEDGHLTAREKALIAYAVANAIHCPYCIDAYTKTCLEAGYSKKDLNEAMHVAAAITGGATLAFGVQMKRLADKLEF